jgi:hypothetical protein
MRSIRRIDGQSRRRRKVVIFVLAAILVILGSYASVFAFDIRIPWINPPDQKNIVPMSIPVTFIPTQREILADISVNLTVTYYGTLVTGTNATLSAGARLQTPSAIDNVSSVEVGFRSSYYFPPRFYDGFAVQSYVVLQHHDSSQYLSGSNVTLYWPTAGDSAPYIRVHFKDGSTLFNSYPEYSIPIQPMSQLQAEKANRVNVGLTVALVGFSLVEGLSTLYDHWKSKDERPSGRN